MVGTLTFTVGVLVAGTLTLGAFTAGETTCDTWALAPVTFGFETFTSGVATAASSLT
jgi:hypothetical protein